MLVDGVNIFGRSQVNQLRPHPEDLIVHFPVPLAFGEHLALQFRTPADEPQGSFSLCQFGESGPPLEVSLAL